MKKINCKVLNRPVTSSLLKIITVILVACLLSSLAACQTSSSYQNEEKKATEEKKEERNKPEKSTRDEEPVSSEETTESETLLPVFVNPNIGETIMFGNYIQNSDGEIAPIEWLVLDVKDGKALLLSKYALDCQKFNEIYDDKITWETSTLRIWLNEDFYDNAFSIQEKLLIADSELVNNNNPKYGTNGGNDTVDKVFVFSEDELMEYWDTSDGIIQICYATDYAVSINAPVTKENIVFYWWLRSPGGNRGLMKCGFYDGLDGGVAEDVIGARNCIRPAIWVYI